MTNKFTAITEAIKAKLIIAGINYVYIYPDDKLGQNLPAAIIEEGEKTFVAVPGNLYDIMQTVSISILSNKLTERSKVMNDLEAAVWNSLLTDLSLGGLVRNVLPLTTDPGAALDNLDRMDQAGFRGNCSVRRLSLSLNYCDTRI